MAETNVPRARLPVLFLLADTGGGHRAAAQAVVASLEREYPGRFTPVLLDPLSGPASPGPLRWVVRLYGPGIRYTPWLWGALYRLTDSPAAMRLLRVALLRLADGPVARAVATLRPAVLVNCHALVTPAAARAAGTGPGRVPVVTLVTDLAAVHTAWRCAAADQVVVGSAAALDGTRTRLVPGGYHDFGLPVAAGFAGAPLSPSHRDLLRQSLGLRPGRFTVLVTGGGEGAGRMARSVLALLAGLDDIDVVAVCGRNERLRRRLERVAARMGGRLTVLGFTARMADWLRGVDVLVSKAGPGTIAEAACCGVAMVLTSALPGQEALNPGIIEAAGAGSFTPRTADLLREVTRLRDDPAALAAMRAASARLGRPGAASAVAGLIAGLAGSGLAPAGLAPAGLATAGVVPAGLASAGLAPAGPARPGASAGIEAPTSGGA